MKELGIFVFNNWLLFMALLVILVMLAMTTLQPKLTGFREIKPADLVRMMYSENPLLLDVRTDDEFNAGHLADALHIPLEQLSDSGNELEQYRGRPVVVYCRTGQRSARAGAILKRQGFAQLYKLSGGMLAWQGAHYPVSKA